MPRGSRKSSMHKLTADVMSQIYDHNGNIDFIMSNGENETSTDANGASAGGSFSNTVGEADDAGGGDTNPTAGSSGKSSSTSEGPLVHAALRLVKMYL